MFKIEITPSVDKIMDNICKEAEKAYEKELSKVLLKEGMTQEEVSQLTLHVKIQRKTYKITPSVEGPENLAKKAASLLDGIEFDAS